MAPYQAVNLGDGLFGQFPEGGIELDSVAAPVLTIKQRSAVYPYTQHLFETERLGAELHLIATVSLRLAALVFDGENGAAFVKLNHVGLAAQAETLGTNLQGPHSTDPALLLRSSAVRSLMQHPSLGRKPVFGPYLL